MGKAVKELVDSIGEEKDEITDFKEYLKSKKIKASDFYDQTMLSSFMGELGETTYDHYTIELGFGAILEGTLPSPKIDNASFFLKFGNEDRTIIEYYQKGSDLDQFPKPLTPKDVNDIYTSFFKGRNFGKAKRSIESGMAVFEEFLKNEEAKIPNVNLDEVDRSKKIRFNLVTGLLKGAINSQRCHISTLVAINKYTLDLRAALLDYCYYSYKIELEGR